MTILEIYDRFIAEYQRECLKRGTNFLEPTPKLFALDVSSGQQDIQRRLKVLESSYSITIVSGVNSYDLPLDYGNHIQVMFGSVPMTPIGNAEFYELSNNASDPYMFSIKVTGHRKQLQVYPTPSSGTITVYYWLDTRIYQPSVSADQSWGNFDGSTFSGSLKLPDKYDTAINYYLLGKYFEDFELRYDREIARLKSDREQTHSEVAYNLGAVDNYEQRGGNSNTVTTVTTTQNAPDKEYHFTKTYALDAVEKYSKGFGTITVSESSGIITISSSAEFTPSMLVTINNIDITFTYVDASTITIGDGTNYGTIAVFLKVWT